MQYSERYIFIHEVCFAFGSCFMVEMWTPFIYRTATGTHACKKSKRFCSVDRNTIRCSYYSLRLWFLVNAHWNKFFLDLERASSTWEWLACKTSLSSRIRMRLGPGSLFLQFQTWLAVKQVLSQAAPFNSSLTNPSCLPLLEG